MLSWLKARLFPGAQSEQLRGLGEQSVRQTPLQYFLQELHRESLGHELPGNFRRLGGAANQRPFVRQRNQERAYPAASATDDRTKVIKTLINSFRYPRKGPGMMWEACAEKTKAHGRPDRNGLQGRRLRLRRTTRDLDVAISRIRAGQRCKRSKPSTSFPPRRCASWCAALTPPVSERAQAAPPRVLKYRDFLTVMLILKERHMFDDNWIYIHDPSVKVGRIQNFRSWSPEMVPDPDKACYGLEYFCFEHDGLWDSNDEELIELAKTRADPDRSGAGRRCPRRLCRSAEESVSGLR